MKKLLLSMMLMLGMSLSMSAEDIFKHLSAGVELGTTGIGVDLGTNITKFVGVRAGVSYIPQIKVHGHLNLDGGTVVSPYSLKTSSYMCDGKLNYLNGKLLFDVYPAPVVPIFITVGMYVGNNNFLTVTNQDAGIMKEMYNYNKAVPDHQVGISLGKYILQPDVDGNIKADVRTNVVKPYVGIGYGRTVPKRLFSVSVEAGCIFWGKPAVYNNGEKLEETLSRDGNGAEFLNFATRLAVYPVLNIRVAGKLF